MVLWGVVNYILETSSQAFIAIIRPVISDPPLTYRPAGSTLPVREPVLNILQEF